MKAKKGTAGMEDPVQEPRDVWMYREIIFLKLLPENLTGSAQVERRG